jgi:hypothetical protein
MQLLNKIAISAILNNEFGIVEYNVLMDFSYLENIYRYYVL